jgi:hypothetical protein
MEKERKGRGEGQAPAGCKGREREGSRPGGRAGRWRERHPAPPPGPAAALAPRRGRPTTPQAPALAPPLVLCRPRECSLSWSGSSPCARPPVSRMGPHRSCLIRQGRPWRFFRRDCGRCTWGERGGGGVGGSPTNYDPPTGTGVLGVPAGIAVVGEQHDTLLGPLRRGQRRVGRPQPVPQILRSPLLHAPAFRFKFPGGACSPPHNPNRRCSVPTLASFQVCSMCNNFPLRWNNFPDTVIQCPSNVEQSPRNVDQFAR